MFTTADTAIVAAYKELLCEKSMDEVTVIMICRRADVNRQTFYYHFASYSALMGSLLRAELTEATMTCNDYHTWVDGFRAVLTYCRDNRRWLENIWHSSFRNAMMDSFDAFGTRLIRRGITQCAQDFGYQVPAKDREFMLHFYMAVFMDILARYFEENMEDTPDEICERCNRMMFHSIRKTLKNFTSMEF